MKTLNWPQAHADFSSGEGWIYIEEFVDDSTSQITGPVFFPLDKTDAAFHFWRNRINYIREFLEAIGELQENDISVGLDMLKIMELAMSSQSFEEFKTQILETMSSHSLQLHINGYDQPADCNIEVFLALDFNHNYLEWYLWRADDGVLGETTAHRKKMVSLDTLISNEEKGF
jgi:hypothetical protein